MAEVVTELDTGGELVAAITLQSAHHLGLEPGKRVVAVIKATEILIATED